jgi:hypothetical protein
MSELVKKNGENEIIIQNAEWNSLYKLSKILSKAGSMIPQSFQGKTEEIFAALMLGSELGLNPMQSLRSIFVVNGRPSLYGDALLGVVMRTKEVESFEERITENGAICIIKRRGYAAVERTYTLDDAKKNPNFQKSVWKIHTKRMMQMRARAFALRDSFPDVLSGVYDTNEIDEIENPAPVNITPISKETPMIDDMLEKAKKEAEEKGKTEEEKPLPPMHNTVKKLTEIMENEKKDYTYQPPGTKGTRKKGDGELI